MVSESNYTARYSCVGLYHVNDGGLDLGKSDCYYFLVYQRWGQMWATHDLSLSLVHNFFADH